MHWEFTLDDSDLFHKVGNKVFCWEKGAQGSVWGVSKVNTRKAVVGDLQGIDWKWSKRLQILEAQQGTAIALEVQSVTTSYFSSRAQQFGI